MESMSPSPRQKPRKFPCSSEGCGKAFTRAEHLQRHYLNHQPSPNTCGRCRAHFKRPDLLDRHKERHAQKDREAGGVGLGVLGTRKRCWKDENGNITTKRPAASLATLPKPSTSLKSQKGKEREEGGRSNDEAGDMSCRGVCITTTASMSPPPPYSTAPIARRQRNDGGHAHNRTPPTTAVTTTEVGSFDQLQIRQLELTELGMFEDENFQLSPPPSQIYRLDPLLSDVPPPTAEALIVNDQAEFDEAFSVDPASSFTRPFTPLGGTRSFTALGGYTRLFGGSDSPTSADEQSSTGFDLNQEQSEMEIDLESPFSAGTEGSDQSVAAPMGDSTFLSFDVKASANAMGTVPQQYHNFQGLEELEKNSPVEGQSLYFLSGVQPMSHSAPSEDSRAAGAGNITRRSPSRTLPASRTQHSIPTAGSLTSNHNHFHVYASTSESPSPTLPSQPFPKIDEVARAEVLSFIIRATANENGECQYGPNDPFLSLSALQNYLGLFFFHFNSSYPLPHRLLFDPSNVSTLLLVSVLMLGATYGGKDAHQMAVRVHDGLRGVLGLAPEVWERKSGTNLCEFEREQMCSLVFMLPSSYGLCKRCC